MDQESARQKLEQIAKGCGITLFGVADIEELRWQFNIEPKEVLESLRYGISLGVRLSDKIVETLEKEPTKIYSFHYRRVNILLDEAALKITSFIQERGYDSLPIPASQVIDWKNQMGHLSHQLVGREAGLGWIGRCGLLVNPEFGARVRYATLLTDMPLAVDVPKDGGCGQCMACVEACPVGAVKEGPQDFDVDTCLALLKTFSKKPDIGQYICGLCVRACGGRRT